MWARTKALYPHDEFVQLSFVESITLPVELQTCGGNHSIEAKVLVDSGATTNFIHQDLVKRHQILMERLPQDIVVRNVDNTKNSLGSICHKVYLTMKVNGHREVTRFLVTNIGTDDIILGHTWLRKHNPAINWRKSLLQFTQCPPSCSLSLSRKWIEQKHPKAAIKAQRRTRPEIAQRKTVRFTLPDQPLTEEQKQHRDLGHSI